MRDYLIVEFVAQDDDVFKVGREHFLGRVTVVPNLGLAEEIEPGALDDTRMFSGGLGAETDRRSEDPFEAATSRRYSFPPFAMAKVSSICAADLKRMV